MADGLWRAGRRLDHMGLPPPALLRRCGADESVSQEWKNQLRSSLHPALFAGLFAGVSTISGICSVPLALRAELLIAAPKITQAALAASTDYFTWRLAERAFGVRSSAAWASVW